MRMLSIVAERLFYAAALVTAVLVLNFFLVRMVPGDVAEVIAGEMGGVTNEILAAIRKDYGLDKPVSEQLWVYLGHAVQGDLGHSFYYNSSVVDLVLDRMGATVILILAATVMALFIGTFMGVMASRKPQGPLSNFLTIFSLVGYSAPAFWTGMMLIILFALIIPIFPVSDMIDITKTLGPWGRALDIAHHLVLPAFTLGVIYIAQYSRLSRASMLEVLGSDYIRTARAKGLPEWQVVTRHALRGGLIPVVAFLGPAFAGLLAGSFVVETIFQIPGLGRFYVQAAFNRDYTMILGTTVFLSTLIVLFNLLSDILAAWMNPRLRAQFGGH
jgi:peptide/nickel transport system permease protein